MNLEQVLTSIFDEVFTNAKDKDNLIEALVKVLPEYHIDTPKRVSAFLAQCGHESAGWSTFSENLNYSADALNRVFPKYFKNAGRNANDFARKPEKIANIVYANRMGNGPISSGDGWTYRGRGPIQLTGKSNYQAFASEFGIDVVKNPDLILINKEVAIKTAIWYWQSRNLNVYADVSDIKTMTKLINGGYHGLNKRELLFNKCLTIFDLCVRFDESKDIDDCVDDISTIRRGDTGLGVKMIQSALGLVDDGIFGPATERAVMDWQRRNGLTPDGIVGPLSLVKLYG